LASIRQSLIPFALGAALLAAGGVRAAERPAIARFVSEIRLGIGVHDPWSPERGTLDARATILFHPLFAAQGPLPLMIRPHLGGALNTASRTSHLHAGLTLTLDVTKAVFVEASLGGAIHDGKRGAAGAPGHSSLGCAAQFRESLGIGYRLAENWTMTASIEHLSNGGLCAKNRGLTNLGVELGYRF
jgi:hypothetical protein